MALVAVTHFELFLLFFFAVQAISLFSVTFTNRTDQKSVYANLRKDISFAPPAYLFGIVWFILDTLAAIAAFRVRLDGNYIEGVNLAGLICFWVLQVVKATFVVFFFRLGWLVVGTLIVFVSLLLVVVTGIYFLENAVWAGVFLFAQAVWLLFALVLSLAILRKSMWMARKIVRSLAVRTTVDAEAGLDAGQRRVKKEKK